MLLVHGGWCVGSHVGGGVDKGLMRWQGGGDVGMTWDSNLAVRVVAVTVKGSRHGFLGRLGYDPATVRVCSESP